MFDNIKELYALVANKVVEIEKLASNKTGAERKDILIDYLAQLVNIPYIPDSIEMPLKKAALGKIVDLVVEKLNIITGWDIGAIVGIQNFDKMIAGITAEPVAPLLNKVEGTPSTASIDEKLAVAMSAYGVAKNEDKFDKSIEFSLKWEGGKNYTFDSATYEFKLVNTNDKGGLTNMGITIPTFNRARASGIITAINIDELTKNDVKAIYKANYWDNYGWGALSYPVCLCTLDCSINHGGFAWILQRACKDVGIEVVVDGKFGPATYAALKLADKQNALLLARAIVEERKVYYAKIIAKDPSQKANEKGWLNRCTAMLNAVNTTSPL